MKIENDTLLQLLNDKIVTKLKDETVKVNDREYISMDVFMGVVRECMMLDIMLGTILAKEGDKKVSDEEILLHISTMYDKTDIKYSNGSYTLVSI